MGGEGVDADTLEGDRAVGRVEEAGDGPQDGGLTGAVGSNDGYDLPFLDGEGYTVQGQDAVVADVDLIDF